MDRNGVGAGAGAALMAQGELSDADVFGAPAPAAQTQSAAPAASPPPSDLTGWLANEGTPYESAVGPNGSIWLRARGQNGPVVPRESVYPPADKAAAPTATPPTSSANANAANARVDLGRTAGVPPETSIQTSAPPPKELSDADVFGTPPPPKEGGSGLGRGLLEGVGNLIGLPGDLAHMTDRAYEWAMTKALEKAGAITPEQSAGLRAPIPGLDDQWGGSEDVNKTLLDTAAGLGANVTPPQTALGKYTEAATEMAPAAAALGPIGSLKNIARGAIRYGAIPGIASEAAGQATEGTPAEPWARAGAAILAGQPIPSIGRSPNKLLSDVLKDVTPQQFMDAQALLNESRVARAPITLSEAIQSVTNSGTRMGDIQRVVEQSPVGGAITRPFFAQRPAQTETLGRNTLDQISTSPLEPTEVAPKVQNAALGPTTGATPDTARGIEQQRTDAVDPFYQAAATDRVPAGHIEGILKQIEQTLAADKTGILKEPLTRLRNALTEQEAQAAMPAQRVATTTPTGATIYKTIPGTPAIPRVPVTDIENLDRARKFFRDAIDLPSIAAAAVPKEIAGNVRNILTRLRGAMMAASPNFAAGKQLYEHLTETRVAPLQRSLTGQLSQAEKLERQIGILFDHNPPPGSEQQVSRAVRTISAQEPEAAKQLVRIHLEQTFNEATQANLPGANQWGGPKFAAVVGGNPQQAKNIEAALAALPGGPVRLGAYRSMMKIFSAMGTRQAVGSQTSFNTQIQQELRGSRPVVDMLATATEPWALARQAEKVFADWKFRRNTADIARVLTTGNISDLRRLSSATHGSLRAQAALVALVGSGTPANDQQPMKAAQ